jgi:hypothetical protein
MPAPGPSLLRLLHFTPSADDGYVDNGLRSLARSVLALGACAVAIGRRQDVARERVLATVWPDRATMVAALDVGSDDDLGEVERLSGMAEARVEVLPCAFASMFDRDAPSTVLRIFRGRTPRGELESYEREVRDRVDAGGATRLGPEFLCFAHEGPDRFVTVSTWPGWDAIEAATGGNRANPITPGDALPVEGEAQLYEIVPRTAAESTPDVPRTTLSA